MPKLEKFYEINKTINAYSSLRSSNVYKKGHQW